MPYTVNIPIDSYTNRLNEKRNQFVNQHNQQRPRTERIYSSAVNPIAYFNQNQIITSHCQRSQPKSIYSQNQNYQNKTENISNFYYEPQKVPSPRLPPLPPKPVNLYPQKLIESNKFEAMKTQVPRLNHISDEEFIARRKLSKQESDEMVYNSKTKLTNEGKIKRKSSKRQFIIGSAILGLGLVMFASYDSMVYSMMEANMQLKEGGGLTENWQNIPVPMDACFYLFELRNGQKFLQGAKPKVKEYGPFCYFEYKKKKILNWGEHTVTYTESYDFVLNEKESQPMDTPIQVLNLPILLTIYMIKHILETYYLGFTGPVVYNILSVTLRATGEQLIEKRTPKELLDGRKIKMVEYSEMMMKPLKALGIPVPAFGVGAYKMNNASFGFVSQRMNADFGPYEVFTKTEDGHTFGDVYMLEGKETMPTYKFPCNQIKGGDGMFFGPRVKAETLYVFNQHACRSMSLVKNKTITQNGMTLVQYQMDPHIFDMSLSKNRCFCLNNRPWQDCDGWTDMSPCMGGIPMGLSFPHFLNTPRRLKEVDGLEPDPAKHAGYLNMEPQIGIPVGAKISIQGTIAIQAIPSVLSMSSLPKVVLPLFWVQEGATVKGGMAIGMSIASNSVRYGSYAWLLGSLGFGGLYLYRANQTRKHNQRLESME